MKIRLLLTPIVFATLLVLAACAVPGQKSWVEVTCAEFYDNHHINTMPPLEVQVGETFTVNLCSNPSTGFEWSEKAQISDPAVLKLEDHEFIGPESEPPPPPGTPGQEVWTFKTLSQGSSTIYLEYGRPWEGGEKGEWACTVNVVVK